MAPLLPSLLPLLRRSFNPGLPSGEFTQQWTNPGDVFSVLLILGGDVVARALAQLAGSRLTPVTFSFGVYPCGRRRSVAPVSNVCLSL